MAMVVRTRRPLAVLTLCIGLIAAAAPAAATAVAHKPAAAKTVHAKTTKSTSKKSTSKSKKHKSAHKPAAKKEVQALPQTAVDLAQWAVQVGDNHDLPFVVVDKTAAMVLVYDGKGQLLGAAPALVGSATGDDSAPGVGDRELSDIPMDQRTTPAGRFIGAYGAAAGQQTVLWVDYETAISLHPVITSNPDEHRLERIKSPTPDDNRITHGCINVPASFYNKVVRKTFKKGSALFYILPDTKPLSDVFPDFYVYQLTRTSMPDGQAPAQSEAQANSASDAQADSAADAQPNTDSQMPAVDGQAASAPDAQDLHAASS